jgi:hypothetical protein
MTAYTLPQSRYSTNVIAYTLPQSRPIKFSNRILLLLSFIIQWRRVTTIDYSSITPLSNTSTMCPRYYFTSFLAHISKAFSYKTLLFWNDVLFLLYSYNSFSTNLFIYSCPSIYDSELKVPYLLVVKTSLKPDTTFNNQSKISMTTTESGCTPVVLYHEILSMCANSNTSAHL